MNLRPDPPTVKCKCPQCGKLFHHIISFRDATKFAENGAAVIHSYDNGHDLQPITEEDIEYFNKNQDIILKMIVKGM